SGQSGNCCYGAANNTFAAANKTNTQPTNTVYNGLVVGTDSQVTRGTFRGTNFAFTGGDRTRIDESTVWPARGNGPGTASCGYTVSAFGQVAQSQALDLGTGCTGIALTGANGGAIANKLDSQETKIYAKGIDSTATNAHIVSNTILDLSGAG